ncbi:EVE domain-containing protein [Nocardia brasiliensis]|uniref:EVE domain-containing protein n=1 Tax=Nocardia brasiliensis TaxID=37326 RepID=UPI0024570383|nr:EVE domain-containing protein [Nocardia brasiliensis]
MTRYWLNVVAKEHVLRGVEFGITQAGHGKRAAVERMQPGDGLIYYSPRTGIRSGAPVCAFTAIGTVGERPVWQAEPAELPGGGCFQPWRRSISYRVDAKETAIDDLRGELDLTSTPNWGMVLRRGLIELCAHHHAVIARAMTSECGR